MLNTEEELKRDAWSQTVCTFKYATLWTKNKNNDTATLKNMTVNTIFTKYI